MVTLPANPGPEVPGRRAQARVNGELVTIVIPPELDHLFDTRIDFYSISTTCEHDIIPPGLCPDRPEETTVSDFPDRNLDTLHQRTASGQKQFIALTETNESEGEVWRFWLQVLGNEDELRNLWALIDAGRRAEEFYPYEMTDLDSDGTTPESEVDTLVKHDVGAMTYMAAEHKITGRFTCPKDLGDEWGTTLYKGGIKELFI